MVDKDPVTKNVDVLWIQTENMKKNVSENKPRTFQTDTTFGTQKEGFKLYAGITYCPGNQDMTCHLYLWILVFSMLLTMWEASDCNEDFGLKLHCGVVVVPNVGTMSIQLNA